MSVLGFLAAHWRTILAGVGGAVLGAYLGRVTTPKPVNPPPPTCPACPELHCATAVDAGVSSQADCKSKVRIEYVTVDAGCPTPVVTVDTSGSGFGTAGAGAGATSDAKPPLPQPLPPVVALRPVWPVWEVGAGVGVSMEGHLHVPVGVRWYPGGGALGLGVEGGVRPSDWKQSSIGISINGRWGP